MARHSKAFNRYILINDIFNRHRGKHFFVTTEELLQKLDISQRQLRTDMEEMRKLGAPLEYVASQRGWHYTMPFDFSKSIPLSPEDMMQLRLAVSTLEKVNQLPEFQGLSAVVEKIRQSVSRWVDKEAPAKSIYFDPLPVYEGVIHLPFFLTAIESTRQVSFEYKAFHSDLARPCVVDPYFLRQHHQRWYLGGFSHDEAEGFIRTYPLERIIGKPDFTGRFFDRPKDYDPASYWQYIIGIFRPPDASIQRVVLAFNALQGRYFLSQPFFEPFDILESTPEKLVIALNLMIDIELIRRIASYGKDIEVIEPRELVIQMLEFFQAALALYRQ